VIATTRTIHLISSVGIGPPELPRADSESLPRRHDVAPAPAGRDSFERPTRHEHDDALVGIEAKLRVRAVDDVEICDSVNVDRAVGPLERKLVADRERREPSKVRVDGRR
jgi:hypothetical protein